ncbi:hypothetical protein ATANTOWER_020968 [Ataeniobius toweri]|uniref:Uncharacterized protein n=1 Tax=Ataeniobius toweri TaxID=208326 RepID=A0ABU7BJE9_9TELE|nr:hypothetical protein [Ataeniobius toweri]
MRDTFYFKKLKQFFCNILNVPSQSIIPLSDWGLKLMQNFSLFLPEGSNDLSEKGISQEKTTKKFQSIMYIPLHITVIIILRKWGVTGTLQKVDISPKFMKEKM